MTAATRRVVVTGVGLVTPLGTGRDTFWPKVLAGVGAADEVRAFDTSQYRVHRGCEVPDFDFAATVGAPPPPGMGRATQFALAATVLALRDANLAPETVDPRRIGVSVGTTCGEIQILEDRNVALLAGAARADDAAWLSFHPACAIPTGIGHWLGLAGPNVIIPTACAAGNFSIGYAMDVVQRGRADVMVAGGTDPFSRVAFTGFARLGSVAPRVCQPFDRHRRGILVGEGAGIVLVEALDHARARGASIHAELLGYGLASDARHMTAPDPEGDGIARAMTLALRAAGIGPEDVDYVCAHGTGTPINDAVETKGIKRVLGARATGVPISSIKSMLGHTMGAASAIETIACTLALGDGVVPPTINYETPDPACDLDYVPNRSRPQRLRVALNNALAFGGVNSCLALGRWEAAA
jgi:3-oxoacyl-[acyl-carrier-protein] synthase II